MARAAMGLLALSMCGCRAPIQTTARRPAPQAAISADAIGVGEIFTPDSAKVAMTCTPTGLELCFDATDNNCNGIIDEGCGVQTGPCSLPSRGTRGSDVDLNVTDPKGELVKHGRRTRVRG